MVMRDTRLEVPYERPEEEDALDRFGKFLKRTFVRDPNKYPTTGRTVDFSGVSQRDRKRMAAERQKRGAQTPGMGSMKNVDAGTGRGTTTFKQDKKPAIRAQKPAVATKPAGEYVAPSSPESAQTAGIKGLEGGPSGMSAEREMETGRTTYFGESPEDAVEVAQRMRKGLFGEDISQEDYDRMTQKNKEGSFWGQFKKGGQVKKKPVKKYAKGGTVSSASKRGDGICQRGKTKGRMV